MTAMMAAFANIVGGQVEYVMTAGQDLVPSAIGFANGVPVGDFGVLDPSDYLTAKILQLLSITGGSDRLVISMDDETLPDNFFSSILVDGFARLLTSEATFILHGGGQTDWGWDGFGLFVNNQSYDLTITG